MNAFKDHFGRRVLFGAGLAVGLLLSVAAVSGAATDGSSGEVPLALKSGESFVIKGLKLDSTPAVHVEDNPGALLVHSTEPGELVLTGAESGEWKVDVETTAGKKVTYDVAVNSAPEAEAGSLKDAAAATSATEAGAAASSVKSVAKAPLDSGSGPVATEAVPASEGFVGSASPAAGGSSAEPVLASSAGGATLPPISGTSAPAAPPPDTSSVVAAASGSTLPPVSSVPSPTYTHDSMGSGSLMPSQSIPTTPMQGPLQNFKSNPLVEPHSDSITGGTHFLPNDVVDLASGTSRIFDFPRRIRRISVADTEVADIQVINPYQINLIGHKEGFTTLAIWDNRGVYEERQVRVDRHGRQQVMLNVIVAELNRSRLEGAGVNWSFALPNYNVSLVGLGANVATQYTASSALTPPEIFGAGLPNSVLVNTTAAGTLPPQGTLIPLLLSPNVNYGLAAGNNNVQTQTFFEALEQHNLAKILAEPHLLANSGEQAEFLSGGEIPIVISQALNTSIVFKQFGTSVIFVPTVIGSNDIGLEVKPEVSQPDYAHGVNLFGFTVPAFVTRKADTYVRLKDNQTLIIAGLLLRTKTSEVTKTPYLGDIPYLGMLFKSTSYQEAMTDLVMSVTPQIVGPLPNYGQVALPTNRGPMSPSEIRTRSIYPVDASRPRF
jgi:Flp pilus assembly secretin CpaC